METVCNVHASLRKWRVTNDVSVQVAILTLLEGENALLELKAGDDAAKARCVQTNPPAHTTNFNN
jgi:hypothetical protein